MDRNILQDQLNLFRSGNSLPDGAAAVFFDALLAETDEDLLRNILIAWQEKGTSEDELFSLASIMRQRAIKVNSEHELFVDAVGTGGSSAKTFNISTAAAFVIAGAGVAVAKHGNRAATSNSGSADVLSALGIEPAVDAAKAEECLNAIGICFMFAPKFHSLSPMLAKVRRELGIPTIFNNLGPLCNPAGASYQMIGVWHKDLVLKTANVLERLGTKRSWVVHGEDGLDEITLNGKTSVAEIADGKVQLFDISPADFGLEALPLDGIKTSSAKESADLIRSILLSDCKTQAAIDIVLMNAAAPIYFSGVADTLPQALAIADQSLTSGAAFQKLLALAEMTNR